MFANLPASLIQSTLKITEDNPVLPSCVSCGAVLGSCIHSEGQGLDEDNLSAENVPGDNEPEDELSGEKEEVVINPAYQTFNTRFRG